MFSAGSFSSSDRGSDFMSLQFYILSYTKCSFSALSYATLSLPLTLMRDEKLISILFLVSMPKISLSILFLNPSYSCG